MTSERAVDLREHLTGANDLVSLRPWRIDDLPTVAAASQDAYIPLITTVPAEYTLDTGLAWVERQREKAASGRSCPMAVVEKASGQAAGAAVIDAISWRDRRAAVGYWIIESRRGRGLAGAAIGLLPDIARQIGLIRLEALIEPDNLASERVCRASGFEYEGTLRGYYRIGDTQRDMMSFSLLLSG